ncbi:MAG: alpha/beta hydrolase [Thermomicrobiales bacterium]
MFLPINGHRINVVAFGPGPRTFLGVGGWAGSWELWQQPFETLSRSWRTVAYDHRGSGETVVPPEAITLDGLLADLFGVLDALGIDRCVLGAESAGARTALAAALARPERFEGLVIVDGEYTGRASARNPFAEALRADFDAALDGFVAHCVPGDDQGHIRRWGRNILVRSRPEPAARLAELGVGFDLTARLGDLRLPTLIIHAARDRLVPLARAHELHALLPESHLVVLDADSHVPTMTHAGEVVAAITGYFGAAGAALPPG